MSLRTPLLHGLAVLGLTLCPGASDIGAQIPSHPDEISFPTLDFEPPLPEAHRYELDSGVPVFLAPSTEWPLVNISFIFKGGTYLEGEDEAGLASMVGSMMRRGGTTTVNAEELDERFDFLAANVSSFVGGESAGASIDCLKSNLDEAFALFMDMVKTPGFDTERLRVQKDQMLEGFRQRNDSPMSVAMSNMRRLAYGSDHYLSREPTEATIEAVDPAALRRVHGRIFHPGNLIIAATGDFEVDEMLARLEVALDGWPAGERAPNPPAPTSTVTAGLYHAGTTQADLPQGTTIMIGPGVQRDDPDMVPLQVMNDILGGGGFTSRITNRVRSDEGLAYSASSFMQPQVYYPGLFGAFYQSKNRTVALAAKIIVEEIDRIRTEPVTEEELERAKNSFIEAFPSRFASKSGMLSTFVNDEITGRDPTYWSTYRAKMAAVSQDDVKRVAAEHLDADTLAVMVIGDWAEIEGGDLEGRATMAEFGEVIHLPMLDPMTREPMDREEVLEP